MRDRFQLPRGFLIACGLLFIFDVSTSIYNRVAPYTMKSKIDLYRWRGFSIVGHARRIVAEEPDLWAGINERGLQWKKPFRPLHPLIKVTVFGSSYAEELLDSLPEYAPHLESLRVTTPGAGIAKNLEDYKIVRKLFPADARLIGLVESDTPETLCLTRLTYFPEFDLIMTYPRYRLLGSNLVKTEPLISSFEGLQFTLAHPDALRRFTEQLEQNDVFYNPWEFNESIIDYSTIARWIRYHFAFIHRQSVRDKIMRPDGGIRVDSEALSLLKALLRRFAQDCRSEGTLPVVVLFSQGTGSHFKSVLSRTLEESGIVVIAASDLIDVDSPESFAMDGLHHYTPPNIAAIAKAVDAKIVSALRERRVHSGLRAGSRNRRVIR